MKTAIGILVAAGLVGLAYWLYSSRSSLPAPAVSPNSGLLATVQGVAPAPIPPSPNAGTLGAITGGFSMTSGKPTFTTSSGTVITGSEALRAQRLGFRA